MTGRVGRHVEVVPTCRAEGVVRGSFQRTGEPEVLGEVAKKGLISGHGMVTAYIFLLALL